MSKVVQILEVGPRDGLQLEPTALPTAMKVELIHRLMDAGVRRIEATSFVNPRKVPQMADADSLMQLVRRPADVSLTGLVLNEKGLERALRAGCNEIGMVVVATDTFSKANQGMSCDQSLESWLRIARTSRRAGIRYQVTVSAAFGCPFEGEVPLERVLKIAERASQAQPIEICFADTIGVAVPRQVTELFSKARTRLPGIKLRAHFHNTRNTGIANALAAVEAGVDVLDASIGGIGGCPFAPAATGNIATEDLQYALERSGVETGLSLRSLLDTTAWLESALGRALPSMVSKAGPFPSRGTAERSPLSATQ